MCNGKEEQNAVLFFLFYVFVVRELVPLANRALLKKNTICVKEREGRGKGNIKRGVVRILKLHCV